MLAFFFDKDCASASVPRAHRRGGRLVVPVVQKSPNPVDLLAQPDASLYSPLVLRVVPIALFYHLLIHCSYRSSYHCFRSTSRRYGRRRAKPLKKSRRYNGWVGGSARLFWMAAVGTGSIGAHTRIHHPLSEKRYSGLGEAAMTLIKAGSNKDVWRGCGYCGVSSELRP